MNRGDMYDSILLDQGKVCSSTVFACWVCFAENCWVKIFGNNKSQLFSVCVRDHQVIITVEAWYNRSSGDHNVGGGFRLITVMAAAFSISHTPNAPFSPTSHTPNAPSSPTSHILMPPPPPLVTLLMPPPPPLVTPPNAPPPPLVTS